jgi:uncharacterized delta-60 repeat protein
MLARMRALAVVTLLLASLSACTSVLGIGEPGLAGGDAAIPDAGGGADAPAPDAGSVAIAAAPARTRVVRADQATLEVTLATPAPAGGVTLSVLDLPMGITAPDVDVPAGQTTGMLTVTAGASATLGLATVRVHAERAGVGSDEESVELWVTDAPGAADLGFGGGDGVATFAVGGSNAALATSVIAQPDGKIVVGLTHGGMWTFVRFLESGAVDGGFGTGGVVTYQAGTLRDMVALADGKYLAVGDLGSLPGIVRFNADGTPDDGFGSSGKVAFPPGAVDGQGHRVAVDAAGGIWVAGAIQGGMTSEAHLYKISATGTLDATFPAQSSACTAFRGVAVQPVSGRIVTACTTGAPPQVTLMRWSTSGQLDATFGAGGVAVLGPGPDDLVDLAVHADDGLVAAGSNNQGPGEWLLVRAEADGAPAGGMGVRSGTVEFSSNGFGQAVVIDDVGRIVLAAFGSGSFAGTGELRRFLGDGSDDATFAGDGTVVFGAGDFTPKHRIVAVTLDPLGRVIAVGNRDDAGVFVARVWP